MPLNVWILVAAQALAMCTAPFIVFIGSIQGRLLAPASEYATLPVGMVVVGTDRNSTRLNSSHVRSSYAVFCLKKKISTRHHGFYESTRPQATPERRDLLKSGHGLCQSE